MNVLKRAIYCVIYIITSFRLFSALIRALQNIKARMLAWMGGRRRLVKERKARRRLAASFAAVAHQVAQKEQVVVAGNDAEQQQQPASSEFAAVVRKKYTPPTAAPNTYNRDISLDILAIQLPNTVSPAAPALDMSMLSEKRLVSVGDGAQSSLVLQKEEQPQVEDVEAVHPMDTATSQSIDHSVNQANHNEL